MELNQFDDFDQLCETVKDWQFDLQQLDRGSFRGQLGQTQLGDTLATFVHLGRQVEQVGASPEGIWTFGIPLGSCPRFRWRGQPAGPGDICIMSPGLELHATSWEGFRMHTISIPEVMLIESGESMGIDVASLLRPGVLSSGPLESTAWVSTILARAALLGEAHHAHAQKKLCARLIAHLHSYLPGTSAACIEPRSRILKEVAGILRAHQWDMVSVGDLCRATETSERTLRRVFNRDLGLAPKAYLLASKLNEVRGELRQGQAGNTRVCDVANRWGFWHMSSFATQYRRHFGELPSITLARGPTESVVSHEDSISRRG